ncbi:MAG: DMT family transporter [Planctomycetota bacterium]
MREDTHSPRETALAVSMLVLTTALWGVSFPAMKALLLVQAGSLPGRTSWFFASLAVACRFSLAALALLAFTGRRLLAITRSEWSEGLGIGVFGGAGILLQADGLAHTSASVSAFLTQCYAVLIPLWTAAYRRRFPSAAVLGSCALVLAGSAVLSGVSIRELRVGRGELETLAAAACFAGQILWLARPRYRKNDTLRFSFVSFAAMAALAVPVAAATAKDPADLLVACSEPPALAYLAILAGPSTLGANLLMNRFQPLVSATRAGIVYCFEPAFASAFALFLPGVFSSLSGIAYADETVTARLAAGGGLILAANLLVLLDGPRRLP